MKINHNYTYISVVGAAHPHLETKEGEKEKTYIVAFPQTSSEDVVSLMMKEKMVKTNFVKVRMSDLQSILA